MPNLFDALKPTAPVQPAPTPSRRTRPPAPLRAPKPAAAPPGTATMAQDQDGKWKFQRNAVSELFWRFLPDSQKIGE